MTSLLPPNSTPLERAIEATIAAQLGALPVPLRTLWNPASCPEALLPWLAATLGVESWDATWPVQVKRARIAAAIAILRHNGTQGAVEAVVAAYGGSVVLTNWFETTPPGTPFTFALTVAVGGGATPPSADFITGLIADVSRAKGARDQFSFGTALTGAAAIGVLGYARPAVYARLELIG